MNIQENLFGNMQFLVTLMQLRQPKKCGYSNPSVFTVIYIYHATAPACRQPCFAKLEQVMTHAGKTNAFSYCQAESYGTGEGGTSSNIVLSVSQYS